MVISPTRGQRLGRPGDEVIPWLDQPPPAPIPPEFVGNQLKWEELDSWRIPAPQLSLCHSLRYSPGSRGVHVASRRYGTGHSSSIPDAGGSQRSDQVREAVP